MTVVLIILAVAVLGLIVLYGAYRWLDEQESPTFPPEPPSAPPGRIHSGHHFRMRHPDRLRMEHHRGTER